MGLVWDYYPEGGAEMLTLLKLADHANHQGGDIFPSVRLVAELTNQSDRTVQRHIRNIEAKGWLILEREAYRPGQTRRYRIPVASIPQGVVVRVTKCHPSEGVTTEARGVTNGAERGDTAMSPEPSLEATVTKPSVPARTNGALFSTPEPEVVIQLPLINGKQFPVTKEWVDRLEPIYPNVDVPTTLREMLGWLEGHPERRKTQRGVKGFITSWLQREEQKYGRQVQGATANR